MAFEDACLGAIARVAEKAGLPVEYLPIAIFIANQGESEG